MLGGILVDEKGRIWPESASELGRRIGHRGSFLDLPAHAVRRGLIHIVPKGNKIRVSLCAGRFSFSALAGTLHALHEEAPRRILLAVLSGEEWSYAICSNVAELAARAEDIANEKPFRRRPWLAIEISNQTFVNSPTSNRAAPLLRLWQETRGRMPENLLGHLREAGLLARSVVARPHGASSRLVIEYFGCGFTAMMKPCKSLLLVGRDLGDDYDQGYGGWVAETYARALSERRLRLAFIDATFQVSEGRTIRARYDRALIPWSRKSGELFVLGISINRSLSVVS